MKMMFIFLYKVYRTIAPSSIVKIVKGTMAREIYKNNPEGKKNLWGGHIWTAGYYINTVGAYANEEVIRAYVEIKGKEYKKIYDAQLSFLDDLIWPRFDTPDFSPG